MSLSYVRLRQLHFRQGMTDRFQGLGRTAIIVVAFFGALGVLAPSAPPAIPWLRAGLLIDFVLSLYPLNRRDPSYREQVVRQLRLSDIMDAPMGSLSAGMAKKVLLAAALIASPTVLLFDEPVNEIDSASCDALVSLLAEYRSNRVMLVATHHLAPFEDVTASVLTLESGATNLSKRSE